MRVRPPLLRLPVAALLALTAALSALPAALPAAAQERVGVNAAVNTDANGTPPGGAMRRLVIGQEVVHNEHITTDTKGQTQILFLDGSSVSVGPNADMLIDDFVYDPATGTGKMTLTAVQGAMRFVGGKLSKQENAVTLRIGTATIGVRGGVFVAEVQPGGKAEVIFVYGKAVKVSGQSGCSQELYRSGFAVDINGSGGCPDSPHAAPPGATAAILGQLDGRAGGTGGATTVPTNAAVANSGVPNTVSNNVTASIQQSAQNSPPAAAPPAPTAAPPQATQNLNTTSSQSQPVAGNPAAGNMGGGVTVSYTSAVFVDVYSDGTETTEPLVGATVANGRLTVPSQGNLNGGSIPLPVGTSNFGPITTTNGKQIVGTTFLAPDGSLFFGYGNNVGQGLGTPGGDTTFLLGGTPTVNLPTMGMASYSGSAFGGVQNNGNSYIASGVFTASYNFGTSTGSMTISNLDGKTFGGVIAGSASVYSSSLAGSGLVGAAAGLFFGSGASTTGGVFAVTGGPSFPHPYGITGVYGGTH